MYLLWQISHLMNMMIYEVYPYSYSLRKLEHHTSESLRILHFQVECLMNYYVVCNSNLQSVHSTSNTVLHIRTCIVLQYSYRKSLKWIQPKVLKISNKWSIFIILTLFCNLNYVTFILFTSGFCMSNSLFPYLNFSPCIAGKVVGNLNGTSLGISEFGIS